jgi:hypothetical protein
MGQFQIAPSPKIIPAIGVGGWINAMDQFQIVPSPKTVLAMLVVDWVIAMEQSQTVLSLETQLGFMAAEPTPRQILPVAFSGMMKHKMEQKYTTEQT